MATWRRDLAADGSQARQRRRRPELLRLIGALDEALVDGVLTGRPLGDVLLHPEDLDQRGVVVGAVLNAVQIAVRQERGDTTEQDRHQQDRRASSTQRSTSLLVLRIWPGLSRRPCFTAVEVTIGA